MTFDSLQMLFLIWAAPVLFLVFLFGFKRRRRILEGFAGPRTLRAIVPDGAISRKRRWLKAGFMMAAVILIAIALAGPRYGYRWQEIERRGIDLMLAIDCSRSMLTQDVKPSRLERAKHEVVDLLTMLQGDRVGLVAFSGTALLQCPLTLDYQAFHLFLGALSPDFLPVGGTDLAGAITTALDGFNPSDNSEKAIIVITDGESTGGDPLQAAEKAAQMGVKLFCIGVGKSEGAPIPDATGGFKKDRDGTIILSRLDETTLEKIALLTGGTYVRSVAGDMDLDVIYTEKIRGDMAQRVLTGGRKQVWENRYQWFLALALALLVLELFVPVGNRPRSRAQSITVALLLICLLASPQVHASSLQAAQEAYEAGDYDTALQKYIEAQLDAPDDPEILYNLGNTYYRLEDYEAAADQYRKALTSEDPALKQKLYYNLGNTSFRSGQPEDALKHYEASLKLDPEDTQARENLEFVKTILAQPKPPPQKGDPQEDGEKSEQQASEENPAQASEGSQQSAASQQTEPSQAQQASGEKNDQKPASPTEYGSEMNPEQAQAAQPSASTRQEAPDQTASTSAADTTEPAADAEQASQSARMLNRLQDKPGRALMPAYQPRQVEKDW